MICIYHYKTEQHPSSSTEDFANRAFVLIKDVTGSDAIKFLTIEKNKRSQEEAIDVIKKADANDYVIIDTPPLLAATDAQVLARIADATLLVVDPKQSKRRQIVEAKKRLDNVGAKLLGTVMNKLKLTEGNNYYYYYKY